MEKKINLKLTELKDFIAQIRVKSLEICRLAENNMLIPQQLCDQILILLKNLSDIQHDIVSTIETYGINSISDISGIEEVEKAVLLIEKKDELCRLINTVKSIAVVSDMPKYKSALDKLAAELEKADPEPFCIETSKALIADISNGTYDAIRSVDAIDESEFAVLILACMFKKLTITSMITDAEPVQEEQSDLSEIKDETDEPEHIVESVTGEDHLEYDSFISGCNLNFSANTCEAIGNILTTEASDASKKYSVSNLKNIVSKKGRSSRIPNRLYGEIMYHARHGGLNDESFCLCGNADREKLGQTLSAGISFLYNKGLLKKVSLNGCPDIYIPSGIGETLFVKDKLRSLIDYNYSPKRPYEADFFLNSRGVKMVHILNKCLLRITSNIYTKKVSVSTGVSNAGANLYKIVHVPNEEIYCCSFLPLKAEDIVNTAKDFLETIEKYRNAIYVAASSERVYTDALCRLIIEKLGDAPYLKLYAYSYNEDLFFGCSGDVVDLKAEILYTESDETVSEAEETFDHDEQMEIKDLDEVEESISVIKDDEKGSISEDIVYVSDDSDDKEEEHNILNTDRNEEVFASEDTVMSDMPRIQSDVPVKASAPVYKISYDTAKQTAIELLLNNKVYCMLPYLKAASNENPDIEKLYLCVAYAFDDPMENVRYNSDEIISLLDSGLFLRDDFTIGLIYAAALRNFFSNHTADDYSVNQLKQIIDMPEMKTLAQEFINYKKRHRCGVEAVCDYSVREYIKISESLDKLSGEAAELYAQYVETPYTGGARVTRVKDTAEQIFDRNNFIAECLKYVKNGDVDSISVAEEFVSQFMKSEKISEDNSVPRVFTGPLVKSVSFPRSRR